MAIDLRNIRNKKNQEIKKSYIDKDIKRQKSSHTHKNSDITQADTQTNLIHTRYNDLHSEASRITFIPQSAKQYIGKKKIQKFEPISQWILLLYFAVFFTILIVIYVGDWTSSWQLPKTLGLILGSTGALILSITLWIFGNIKHTVKLTLLDVMLMVLGFSIIFLSIINPNQIAFWGSLSRMFDSGIFILFLIVTYFIIRLFLEYKFLILLGAIYSFIIFLGSFISVLLVYIPTPSNIIAWGSKLAPSYSFITESPQELLLLSLTGLSIWYMFIHIYSNSRWQSIIVKALYIISIIVHILLLIRIPFLPIQILSIIILIIQGILFIRDTKQKSMTSLQSIRLSFVYAIIIIGAIFLMIVKPFNPQYELLVTPDIQESTNILKNTLQNSPILGTGSVLYAWTQYVPSSFLKTSLWDYSFDTLYNEYFNIAVRYGIIPAIILVSIGIWGLISFIRLLFTHRVFFVELFPIIILCIGSLIIPFTVIGKLGVILGVIISLFTITKYLHPITKFSLDLTKTKPQIASLFTFVAITIITGSLFLSTKAINIVRAQIYIYQTIENTNITEVLRFSELARSLAPQIIDYAQISIPLAIQQINQDIFEFISSQNSQQKPDESKTKAIQDKINKVQAILDDYKARFPKDERIIRWQLELYGVIQKYGDVDEQLLLDSVRTGSALRPSSPYWNLYEAQYYIRQSQKTDPINEEYISKAKSLLAKSIEIKPDFAPAYLTYYDIYGIDNNYFEQITILNKYVSTVTSQNSIADKDIIYSLAIAYQNNKQYSEAINLYAKLLDAFPQYTNVYFKLGEIYEDQNQNQEAIKQYKKVLELDPEASLVQEKLNKLYKSK
jgi:tetratricopeptide (TPR) repeat protein